MAGPLLFNAASACSIEMTSAGSLGIIPLRAADWMSAASSPGSIVLFEMTYLRDLVRILYIMLKQFQRYDR